MKRVSIILACLIFLILFVFSFFGKDVYHNYKDSTYWKELSSQIKEERVSDILLDNEVKLSDSERSIFITSLRKSSFYKSNWRQEGPTGAVVTIMFKDGSKQHFQYWGQGILETTYKKGQFLIGNYDIENVLNSYKID